MRKGELKKAMERAGNPCPDDKILEQVLQAINDGEKMAKEAKDYRRKNRKEEL